MSAAAKVLRFGVFELNLETEELRKFGILIRLQPQPFRVLALLASQPGTLVTREQIQQQIWGEETFVDFEQGMNQCVKQIRTALSDSAETPRYVETLPRRGYRFIAPVEIREAKSGMSRALMRPPQPASNSATPPAIGVSLSGTSAGAQASVAVATVANRSPALEPSVPVGPPAKARRTYDVLSAGVWTPVRVGLATILLIALAVGLYALLRIRKDGVEHGIGSSSSATVDRRRTVAVLDFKNVSQRPESAYISTALKEVLTTSLGAGGELLIVSDEDVRRMKTRLHLADTDSLAKDTLLQLHKMLGADYVVLGSYTNLGSGPADKIHIDVLVQDTSAGKTIASEGWTGTNSDLFDLVSRAGAEIRPKLGIKPVSDAEAGAVRNALPSGNDAVRLYSQGLARLRAFELVPARDFLEQAIAAEPAYALAHSALAETLELQGDDRRAREEAQKAFELPSQLTREDRLLIEARYRERNGQRPQAIELYRTLWSDFPDSLEYGLKLARTQTKSGKAKDALGTIESLRKLVPPERDDMRIDLAEAAAAYSLGDYKREQAAATRAVEKAHMAGSGLELARAQIALGKSLFYQDDLDRALAVFKEALLTAQQNSDDIEEASALNNVGGILTQQGHLKEAQAVYEQALAKYRVIGNQYLASQTLINLGTALRGEGDFPNSQKAYEQALAINRESGDKSNEGIVLNNLGELLFLQGNLNGSKAMTERALAVDRETDDPATTSEALYNLGTLLTIQGDLNGARNRFDEALRLQEKQANEEGAAQSRLALANLSLHSGHPDVAEAGARKAADAFRANKLTDDEARALLILASALEYRDRRDAASEAITQATSAAAQGSDARLHMAAAIAAARLQGFTPAHQSQARDTLEKLIAEAANDKFLDMRFEAMLALGDVEMRSGQTREGSLRLKALEREARSWGFILIAEDAARVRQSTSSSS